MSSSSGLVFAIQVSTSLSATAIVTLWIAMVREASRCATHFQRCHDGRSRLEDVRMIQCSLWHQLTQAANSRVRRFQTSTERVHVHSSSRTRHSTPRPSTMDGYGKTGMTNQALLDKIDKLRELNVNSIGLPQRQFYRAASARGP
jgi:hypothetical protein